MKKVFVCFMILAIAKPAHSQDNDHIEFGIDVITPLIWAVGGDRAFDEFEFLYRESQQDKDLRIKLSINNYNYVGKELILGKQIEDNSPISLTYFHANYHPKTSYFLSLGIVKYLSNNKLPVYYGLDGNIGLASGEIKTTMSTIMTGEEIVDTKFRKRNNMVVLGVTPVLGVKKQLTENILFGIEFGINVHSVFGKLEYEDDQGQPATEKVNRFDVGFDRIINDVAFLIKIGRG